MTPRQELPEIERLVRRLREAPWKERDSIKAELLETAKAAQNQSAVEEFLDTAKKGLPLDLKWEIDEVMEALKPPSEPEPEPEDDGEEEPGGAEGQLKASDLALVYDDPRGLQLHKTKVGDRYFATQADPMTGRPRTFELHAQEVTQLKQQLTGSPYWVLGSGEGA